MLVLINSFETPVHSAGSRDLSLNHGFTAGDMICLFLG